MKLGPNLGYVNVNVNGKDIKHGIKDACSNGCFYLFSSATGHRMLLNAQILLYICTGLNAQKL